MLFLPQGVHARVEALANDTVGVLSATRYTAGPDANVAVVMGTGDTLRSYLPCKKAPPVFAFDLFMYTTLWSV